MYNHLSWNERLGKTRNWTASSFHGGAGEENTGPTVPVTPSVPSVSSVTQWEGEKDAPIDKLSEKARAFLKKHSLDHGKIIAISEVNNDTLQELNVLVKESDEKLMYYGYSDLKTETTEKHTEVKHECSQTSSKSGLKGTWRVFRQMHNNMLQPRTSSWIMPSIERDFSDWLGFILATAEQ